MTKPLTQTGANTFTNNSAVLTLLALLLAAPLHAVAQESSQDSAKKTQNPVPDQIKLQLQNYWNFGTGPNNATQDVAHVIPTIPIKLNEDWKLVVRTDVPVIDQPSLGSGTHSAFGIGDINPTFYLSPRKPGAIIWGFGPSFTLPTSSDSILGSGKWGTGPAAVVLTMHGPWVVGTRINNEWSVGGWGDKEINQMWIQPFIHYNLSDGWYIATLPSITANWKASSDNRWTVPLGGGVGKNWKLAKGGSIDGQLQAFYNVERPDGAADWQLFIQFQVMFPKSKEEHK
jgi:hypothetical protein